MHTNPPIDPFSQSGHDISHVTRPFPPVGLIVDGGVADAMGLAFRLQSQAGVPFARTRSETGVEVVVVKRLLRYSADAQPSFDPTVDALTDLGVRQLVALTHRVLESSDQHVQTATKDGLTVGVLAHCACTRLFSASFDCIDGDSFVDGVFLREPDDENSAVLAHEARLARMHGFCVCLLEATTLRSDSSSHASEERLGQIMLRIPDAISPLSACYCQNVDSVSSKSRR